MTLGKIYKRIALFSPFFEIVLRQLYWRNYNFFKRFNPYKKNNNHVTKGVSQLDFNKILLWLQSEGVRKGDLIIIHSSYDSLECTGLSPEEIIDKLISLVGPKGTVAMPVIRRYKGSPKGKAILTEDLTDTKLVYKVRKTAVVTGLLPYSLMKREDSYVSHHPLNPMAAVGALAKEMMVHNLDGDTPSPHGPNSSWKFCYDHNAWIIGLGVDLQHYTTIAHVAEEAFGDWRWSDEEWYRLRKFEVIDDNFHQEVVVKERKPHWGMKNCAEMYSYQKVLEAGLVQRCDFGDGVRVCIESSRDLVDFLRSRNHNGYPYYELRDFFKLNS